MNKESKKLPSTVWKLGVISLFADISSEMLYPIAPIFLTSVLGASMIYVGLIEGITEAISSFIKIYAGSLSDRILKRKPFIWVGYLLAALSKPLIGSSTSWVHVLIARLLDRTGKGIRTAPRDALLAESVSFSQRGLAFGWHRALDTLGAALGPLVALAYLNFYSDNLRGIYFLSTIPGLFAVFLVFFLREQKSQSIEKNTSAATYKFNSDFKKYLAAWSLFSVTNSSDAFLIMKVKTSGVSLNEVILMYCFYNLFYAILSPYLGQLSDKLGRKKVLVGGLLLFAFVYAGFAWAEKSWHFWILFALYGIYNAATEGISKAFAVDLVDHNLKATGLGALGMVTGISALFSSTVAGALWEYGAQSWPFLYGSIGALIGAIFIWFFIKKSPLQSNILHELP